MKEGWEVQQLGSIASINYGYTESATTDPIGPQFLRITDIQNDCVNWHNVPYCKIESTEIQKFKLASGDIVFARTGATTGKSYLVKEPPNAVFASYLIRLRLLEKKLLPEFILYFFQTSDYWQSIKIGSSGSAQGGFNATKLAALTIPSPPLSEQKRIVSILDEAFSSIATAKANAEKNLKNARELFESYLQAVFNSVWQTGCLVKLSDLASDITDGDHMPPPKAPQGVPFITIGNIIKHTHMIDFYDTFKVSREYFDSLKFNKRPKKGDVLYTVTGSFGIPVLVTENRDFCFQRHIGLVRPKPKVSSEWLYYLLMSPQVFEQANNGATGTAQRTVSLKLMRNFQVPSLPINFQRAIAAKCASLIKKTRYLESVYQQKLIYLEELKKSILHQAFNGNLR